MEEEIASRADSEHRLTITDVKLLHQWRNVLRLKVGGEVLLFDGFGLDHLCELIALDRHEAICLIRGSTPNEVIARRELYLFVSLLRKDRFEWLLEKATELGVSRMRPVITDRSEVKEFNLARARDIMKEAAEQSGRGNLPALYEPMELQNVFKEYQHLKTIAFDPHGTPFKKYEFDTEERIGAFIGPEGGWSARELELFQQEKIPMRSLGFSTLRAETAAVAVTSLLLLQS